MTPKWFFGKKKKYVSNMKFDVEYDLGFKKSKDFNFVCSLNPFRMGHR